MRRQAQRISQQISQQQDFYSGLSDEISPEKYAGEGFGQTDEYFPQDIDDKYVRGDVTGEGDYYPRPDNNKRAWPPYRGR